MRDIQDGPQPKRAGEVGGIISVDGGNAAADNMGELLREHDGIEGLAREIGMYDPLTRRYKLPDNENAPPRVRLAVRARGWLHRLVPKGRRHP
ncbi:MAG: hypothetical protein ACLPX7_20660 [Xanthobacteraceae bacterium]